MKRAGKAAKVLTWIVIVMLLLLGVSYIALTDGLRNPVRTVYLQQGEHNILFSTSAYEMPEEREVRFEVKNLLPKAPEYRVRIVSALALEESFDFVAGGQRYGFVSDRDLSKGFDPVLSADSFTIRTDRTLEEILTVVYGSEATLVQGVEIPAGKDLFRLEVVSGGSVLTVGFRVKIASVLSVDLDREEIEF